MKLHNLKIVTDTKQPAEVKPGYKLLDFEGKIHTVITATVKRNGLSKGYIRTNAGEYNAMEFGCVVIDMKDFLECLWKS